MEIYNFRKDRLKIGLAVNNYYVSNKQFKVTSKKDFGFYSKDNELVYFNGKDDIYSLRAQTTENISLELVKWDAGEYTWLQSSTNEKGKVAYSMNVSAADSFYTIHYGTTRMNGKSDKNGVLKFEVKSGKNKVTLTITRQKNNI